MGHEGKGPKPTSSRGRTHPQANRRWLLRSLLYFLQPLLEAFHKFLSIIYTLVRAIPRPGGRRHAGADGSVGVTPVAKSCEIKPKNEGGKFVGEAHVVARSKTSITPKERTQWPHFFSLYSNKSFSAEQEKVG
jgi:hypothetical protein